jgi:transcriptional regulator with XRE-family HTH domain
MKISRKVVERWFNGEAEPTITNIVRVSKVLGCTPNDLLL